MSPWPNAYHLKTKHPGINEVLLTLSKNSESTEQPKLWQPSELSLHEHIHSQWTVGHTLQCSSVQRRRYGRFIFIHTFSICADQSWRTSYLQVLPAAPAGQVLHNEAVLSANGWSVLIPARAIPAAVAATFEEDRNITVSFEAREFMKGLPTGINNLLNHCGLDFSSFTFK